jgi:hypothetical protein
MDVVPALGEVAPKLGADNAAAAISWINRNSNIHKPFLTL